MHGSSLEFQDLNNDPHLDEETLVAGLDGPDSSRFVPDGSVLASWGGDGAAERLRDRCVSQLMKTSTALTIIS